VDIVLEQYDQDYLIIVELADPPPLQNLAGHLNVYTDDPLQPVVQVPVVGWVSSMNPFELVSAAGDDSRLQALIEDALFREDSVPADAFIPSILGGVTDERAVSLLLKALEHQNWHYRERAVEVLGLLQNRLALEAVRRAVTDDLDEDVRAAAAAALVRIVGKEAYPELVLALQDNDSWVREDAAYLLGNLGDSRAIPPLKQALSDEDEDVRQAAAEALEMLHNKNHARQSGQSLEVD
jgi:HEAT repeat protein